MLFFTHTVGLRADVLCLTNRRYDAASHSAGMSDTLATSGIDRSTAREQSNSSSPSTLPNLPDRLPKNNKPSPSTSAKARTMRYSIDASHSPRLSSCTDISSPSLRESSSSGRDSSLTQVQTPYRIVDIYKSSRGAWYMRIAPEDMVEASKQSPVFRSASLSMQRVTNQSDRLHRNSTSGDTSPASPSSPIVSRSNSSRLPSTQRRRASDGTSKRNEQMLSANSPYISIPLQRANKWDLVADVLDIHYAGWNDASSNATIMKRIKKELQIENISYRQFPPKTAQQAPPKMVTSFDVTNKAKGPHVKVITLSPTSTNVDASNDLETPASGDTMVSKASTKWWKRLSRAILQR